MSATQPFKSQSILQSEDQKLKEPYINSDKTPKDHNVENIKYFVDRLGSTLIFVNRLDYYANSIPIGAFCNAVAFIIFGFTRLQIFNPDVADKYTTVKSDSFLHGIILIFGGLGQITAGFLEYLKARSFSALLYLTLGFYSFSHFYVGDERINEPFQNKNIKFGDSGEKAFFFGAWFIIILPLVLASLKINLFFLAQTGCTCLFFLFRWIGEVSGNTGLVEYTSGVFQTLAGLISFYIFANQIVNSINKKEILPIMAFDKENEVDISILRNDGINTPAE